ncbi:hypothetical protein FSP39_019837 [Pinctada imbricata]|uniref:Alpha-macroglobulin-like TED domain-containing protein n=1 Tax=Pinctada imbricata TaxID=66713 RepID=A0AA89BXQ5_PINIB|nr:hypothetical protein FSP39_019837 [Pinctada imbricata]
MVDKGYLRELGYQHFDGSFSAFGNSDRFGSTWLTSFVLKCFVQAKDALFIDKKVITDAVLWIIRQQRLDGSFNEPGNVIHKAMQVAVFFNVEEDLLEPAFFLNVSLSDENINGFNIRICFSLLREQVITMALLQIGIPTGMEGDVESVSRIPEIKRVEEGYRKIDVYLEEV